jgi:hypothetical protein
MSHSLIQPEMPFLQDVWFPTKNGSFLPLCYESTEEVIVFSIFHDMHIYFHVCYTKASLSCPLDWKLPVTGTQNLLFLGHTPSLLGPTNQLKAGTLSSTHFLSVSSALSHSLQLSLCVCVCECVCVCVCVWYWRLNSGPTPWATPSALFCDFFFKIGSCKLFAKAGFEPRFS